MEDIEKSLYQSYSYYHKGGELLIYEADDQDSKNLLALVTKQTKQAGLTYKVRSNPNENLVCYGRRS